MRSARATVRATANRLHRQKTTSRTADDRVDFAQLIEDHEQQIEHLCREHFSALRTLLREQSCSTPGVDAKEYQAYLSANFDFVRQTMDEGASVLRHSLSGDRLERAPCRRFSRFGAVLCIRRWFGAMPPEPGDADSSPMETQHFVTRRFRSVALEQQYREYHMKAFKPRLRIVTVGIAVLVCIVSVTLSIDGGGEPRIFSGKRTTKNGWFGFQAFGAVPVTVAIFTALMFSDRLLTPRHGQKLVVAACLSLMASFSLPSILASGIVLRATPPPASAKNVTLSDNVADWTPSKLLLYGSLESAGTPSRHPEWQPVVPRAHP